uniref:Uncharacterized protein n=1 Tax=Cacopsylla melanoneura TaxID=428564 RepID=A0A8D8V777_9HEMI
MSNLLRVVVPFILVNSFHVYCLEVEEQEIQHTPEAEQPHYDGTPSYSKERKLFRELFEKFENLEDKYHERQGTVHPEDIEELRRFYADKKEDLLRVHNKDLPPEQRCIYLKFTQYLKKLFAGVDTPPKLSGDRNCPYLKTVDFLKKYVCANEKPRPTEEDKKRCPWIKATNFISENRNLVIGSLILFAFLSC